MKVAAEISDLDEILQKNLKPSEIMDYAGCIKLLVESRHVFIQDNDAFVIIRAISEKAFHGYSIINFCKNLKDSWVNQERRVGRSPQSQEISQIKLMNQDEVFQFLIQGGDFIDAM